MYGLFRNSYDHYKWEDLICTSRSKKKLREYYEKINEDEPLISEEQSNLIDETNAEKPHYVIRRIKRIKHLT